MQAAHFSTALPLLAPGEPPCPDAAKLPPAYHHVLLSAALGSLHRCGYGYFGPDKGRPLHGTYVRRLIERGLLFRCNRNTVRITPRLGTWCARTLCSVIAEHNTTGETSCRIAA
jgi:hypothetical protein